jgi:hypothetical protein
MPLTINALNAGRSAMLIPFLGSSTAELEGIIERFVPKKAISERFRIVTTPSGSEEPDRLV